MRIFLKIVGVTSLVLISACERLGVPDPAKEAALREADARATGSACRHAGRGIEDCYVLNPEAARAAVYAGWKEMNDYMRENNISEVKPTAHPPESASAEASASESASASASASAH
ncbi:hypothetical protein [Undibacterium fentianense]|uniref:Lipoprotein n=1 Tax=Undibacterium fentianense TaxID=2828728 RepID=A0A941ICM1_9BURK|nr:hypothetical protein [Undibacterium fentianense]MBR7800344.1 hypothetical protein [Undibacterium fentianense]